MGFVSVVCGVGMYGQTAMGNERRNMAKTMNEVGIYEIVSIEDLENGRKDNWEYGK